MCRWLNLGVLLASTVVYVWLYVLSVGPARREQYLGERAWDLCRRYRKLVFIPMTTYLISYGLFIAFPPDVGLPRWFPWPWWVSLGVAVVLGVPFGILFGKAARAAGGESLRPDKDNPMYGGIYERIRHPQATGEHGLWVLMGLASHSPFLALFSLVWIPAAWIMSRAEERDLVIRFGRPYRDYMERTGMFLPRRKPVRQSDGDRPSNAEHPSRRK